MQTTQKQISLLIPNSKIASLFSTLSSLLNLYLNSLKKPTSSHNIYIHHLFKSRLIKVTSNLLAFIQLSCLSLEMYGLDVKYIEFTKFILKMVLILHTKKSLLTNNVYEPQFEKPNVKSWGKKSTPFIKEIKDLDLFLDEKAVTDVANIYPELLVDKFTTSTFISEVIYISRPLIYIMLLQKYGSKSFIPFSTSFILEIGSILLLKKKTKLMKLEVEKRFYFLMFYLLKDPIYGLHVKDRVEGVCTSLEGFTITSLFGRVLRDYKDLWETWFYSVNS